MLFGTVCGFKYSLAGGYWNVSPVNTQVGTLLVDYVMLELVKNVLHNIFCLKNVSSKRTET